ncbi:MAG: EFR1 family ferrodoxin, partial [Candidatus Marinimicrobia bacterium]|nr:EFR1 family ferrodoxin [Candidatus Neomarinimicrobiota bacterium]
VNLEKDFLFDHHQYDTFLLTHPVYGAHVPRIVIEKTQALVPGNIHLNVITTYGYVNALGYFAEKKVLGREIDSYYNIKMFNNITTPRLKTPIKSLEKRLGMKNKIEQKINRIADAIVSGRHKIEGIAPQLVGGIFVRKFLKEDIRNNYQTLGVDPEHCTLCGLCVRDCPTHSIKEKGGVFTFQATCTTCMRCYNYCPTQAITINGIYADPEKHTRYIGPWS